MEGLHKVISNKRRFSSIFQLPYVGLSKGKLVQLARWQVRFQGCEQCDLTEYHKLHLKSWGFCWWKVALQHQGRGEVFQVTWQWGICQKGLAKRWDCGVCPKCSAYEHRDAWHFWVGINGFGIKASLWPNRNYFHWSHWKTSQKKISWKSSSIPKTVALWKVALHILPLMCWSLSDFQLSKQFKRVGFLYGTSPRFFSRIDSSTFAEIQWLSFASTGWVVCCRITATLQTRSAKGFFEPCLLQRSDVSPPGWTNLSLTYLSSKQVQRYRWIVEIISSFSISVVCQSSNLLLFNWLLILGFSVSCRLTQEWCLVVEASTTIQQSPTWATAVYEWMHPVKLCKVWACLVGIYSNCFQKWVVLGPVKVYQVIVMDGFQKRHSLRATSRVILWANP